MLTEEEMRAEIAARDFFYQHNELLYRLMDAGEFFLASAANYDGLAAFHPPYKISRDGEILELFDIIGSKKNLEILNRSRLVYENPVVEEMAKKYDWNKLGIKWEPIKK